MPSKLSNTALVAPKAAAKAARLAASTRKRFGPINDPPGKLYDNPWKSQPDRSKLMFVEVLYSSTYSAFSTAASNMISLITTCPAGEGTLPLYTALTLLLAPAIGWFFGSTPTTLNEFVPDCRAMFA